VVAVVVAGLAGVGGPAGAAKTPAKDPSADLGTPKKGGTMTFVSSTEARNIDAAVMVTANGNGGPLGNAIYGTLIWYDRNADKVNGVMAESLTTKDGATWTLKLRPGIKFTDGTPLDAAAVKFSWERLKDPQLGSPARGVANAITSLTVQDPLTLVILLAKANYAWPQLFGHYALNWIVSPTAVAAAGADFGRKPVGAGPFMVQTYGFGQGVTLVRNPNYFRKGLPYLDQINLQWNPDGAQALTTVQAGQAQASVFSQRNLAVQAEQQGLKAVTFTMGGGATLTFNVKKAPFDDVIARRAVSLAVSPKTLIDSVFNGNDSEADTLVVPGTLYYDKSLTLPVNLKGGVNAEAQKLFDQYASSHGGPLVFAISRAPSSTSVLLAQSIQTQLASYKNVTVSIKPFDGAGYLTELTTSAFQSIIAGGNGDPEPGLTELLLSNGSNAWGGYSSIAMDAAISGARSSADPKIRRDNYIEMQKIAIQDVPAIWTNHLTYGIAYNKAITGWQLWGQGNPQMDIVGFAKPAK
jgi:peptide/nickel transport system substrate-binding protein